MRLPSQDSATGRGIKTAAQTGLGTLVLMAVVNLAVSIWNVPGVPAVVFDWLKNNALQVAGSLGVSSGFVALVWNAFRKSVPNY